MKKKVREMPEIRFGLRFKLSAVMIIAVLITAGFLSFSVINQNQKTHKIEMQRLGSTILTGAYPSIENYFINLNKLQQADNRREAAQLREERDKAAGDAGDYFKGIIPETRILDIAFLIDNQYRLNRKWDHNLNALYSYFHRRSGSIFHRIRGDDQLKPSIYRYFMHNVSTESHIVFAEGRTEEEMQFVVVGVPVLADTEKKNLYSDYNRFKEQAFPADQMIAGGQKPLSPIDILEERVRLEQAFIKRLVFHNRTDFNFTVHIDNDTDRSILFNIITWYTDYSNKPARTRQAARKHFFDIVDEKTRKNLIDFNELKIAYRQTASKYDINLLSSISSEDIWRFYYYIFEDRNIRISSKLPLDELALTSFRKDLDGILGLFLFRTEFFTQLETQKNETVNLALSIALRCIIIAIFLPTGIIRKINMLTEGADRIGKRDFNTQINISGSDELSRLSHIFNQMTRRLQKARMTMREKMRMEEELKNAEQIQKALLPEIFPDVSGLKFGSYYSAQTESGGDYFDIIPLDNSRTAVVIADVSGHGVGSGLVMAMTRTLVHSYSPRVKSIPELFEIINNYLYNNTSSNFFVSMFYGIINTETLKLTFCSAGHEPAFIIRDKKIKTIPAGGMALGAVSNNMFSGVITQHAASLHKNDTLLLYSDGIIEAMNAKNIEFGEERFKEAVLNEKNPDPERVLANVVKSLNKFTKGSTQNDDITLLAIRIK